MWTAGKALYLQKKHPEISSGVEIKNSYVMNGDIAQWFGLSFQRPIQGSVTLFFELSIFVIFFCLNIFFLFKYCHFFGIQGSNFGLW